MALLRWVLAGVFLYAGVRKIWSFEEGAWATPIFLNDILNFHVFPPSQLYPAMFVAAYLPWLEVGCGLALLTRRWRLGGLLWLTALMIGFTVLKLSAWYRKLDVSCGCFRESTEHGHWGEGVALNLVLLAMVAVVWVVEARRAQLDAERSSARAP